MLTSARPPRSRATSHRRDKGRSPRRRQLLLAAVILVPLLVLSASIVPALTAPGSMGTTARLAEWARGHGLGPVVSKLEQLTYQPPKVGGTPAAGSPLRHAAAPTHTGPALPAPITPPAQPPLPGEGHWHVIAQVGGKPAMAETFLRPDAIHTSYTVAAVWFNPTLISAKLHPGTDQPGGHGWGVAPRITHPAGLLAAFNSGFRLDDAHGGYYQNGRYAKPLVPGAASMVFYRDGTVNVGAWGHGVHMSPRVAAVRQNLTLLVKGGHVLPAATAGTSAAQQSWGATVRDSKYVWRSGIGITAGGGIVGVIGPRLSARSLAVLLKRAGAVRAMQLDINPEWTSYVLYHAGGRPGPVNLLSTMHQAADRYSHTSARDFVTLHTRTAPLSPPHAHQAS
jgi:hypothetical protein